MKHLFLSLAAVLAFASASSAKEFIVKDPAIRENADGNRLAAAAQGATVYEIVAANDQVAEILTYDGCSHFAVEGSVLSRTIEIDHENRRDAGETVKIFARKVACRKVIRPQ